MKKTNFHTHTTWCDGADSPETAIKAAIGKGFSAIGFSSHAMLPDPILDWTLDAGRGRLYANEIRALAAKYSGEIRVFCGVEADWLPGRSEPSRAAYSAIAPDYIIGSVHFVAAPDGAAVPVDKSPESLFEGISRHFSGSVESFIRAYFAAEREMLAFDFDIAGHLDLVRKFNAKHPFFDESAAWYVEELEKTAAAAAASGKIVEVNTGAISRGWLDDAYPSAPFRKLLRDMGVKFILSSDAHSAGAIDCAFEKFAGEESWTLPGCASAL